MSLVEGVFHTTINRFFNGEVWDNILKEYISLKQEGKKANFLNRLTDYYCPLLFNNKDGSMPSLTEQERQEQIEEIQRVAEEATDLFYTILTVGKTVISLRKTPTQISEDRMNAGGYIYHIYGNWNSSTMEMAGFVEVKKYAWDPANEVENQLYQEIFLEVPCYEISYGVFPEFQRKGIAKTALNTLQASLPTNKILYARVYEGNTPSANLLEKCSFVKVGNSSNKYTYYEYRKTN